jgi:WD40 repeat protein
MSLSITSIGIPAIPQHLFTHNGFPIDMLRFICSFLEDPKDVVHFGLANKRLNVLLSDAPLWGSFLHKHFPSSYAKLKSETESLSVYKRQAKIEHHIKTDKYHLQTFEGHADCIKCMTIRGDKLMTGSYDHTIKIWDLNTKQQLLTLKEHSLGVSCMLLWKDKLVSGGLDRRVEIWDPDTGQELGMLTGHQHAILCMTTWNDQLITGSYDCTIKIWNPNTGQELQTLSGHQNAITCITTWDNKLISGSHDCTIKIWDLNTGQELQTLSGHQKEITCIAIWNNKLISGSDDCTIKIWDLNTGEAQTLQLPTGISGIMPWTDNLVVYSAWGTFNIWNFNFRQKLKTLKIPYETIGCVIALGDEKFISGSLEGKINIWDFGA